MTANRCARLDAIEVGGGHDSNRNSNDVDGGAHRAAEESDRCRALMRTDRPRDWAESQPSTGSCERCGQSRTQPFRKCQAAIPSVAPFSNFKFGIAAGLSATPHPKILGFAATTSSMAYPIARRTPE